MVRIEGDRIRVETRTLTARFEAGALVELRRRRDGRALIDVVGAAGSPVELIFAGQEAVPLTGELDDHVVCVPVNERAAEVRFESWNGDGVLLIAEDEATGDLVVEPGACSSRPGLRACRWNLPGLGAGLELVAPFFQGVRLPLEDPLIGNTHWMWPHQWEAGLAILQGGDGGFWVHCRDTRFRCKSLQVGTKDQARCLGLETESHGPLHERLAAGGLAWRLNVFDGDWQAPAAAYRDWLDAAWTPRPRAAWVDDLRFAVSWCPTDLALLDALARRLEPARVLLHLPNWRCDPYDENYPTYVASDAGRAFVARARQLGFRVMPHCNSVDMDPTHPVYARVRDFQYRDLESRRVQGWTWVDGRVRPVPESNAARLRHRDRKTMIKVHPGLSLWRSLLSEQVGAAVRDLDLETVFLDVTLCSWNLHNGLVEDISATEGMKRLIARVADLRDGLVVGGEGRNEVTIQDQGVAQVHLFRSWHQSADGLERAASCPLDEFLFGGRCRSFGYSGLGGKTDDEGARMRAHLALGALPTVTVHAAADIDQPNAFVAEMLERAAG